MAEEQNSDKIVEVKKINEIPDEAQIVLLEVPVDDEKTKTVGEPYKPEPLDYSDISPDDIKQQLRSLSELSDFQEVLHTLPFITNEHIEEFGWEIYLKDNTQMKKDYLKYKINKKKKELKNNRTKH